jgi:acyl-CoA hydrolase
VSVALAPPAETRLVEMVFPQHTNHRGTLFGGHALRMMDTAAFVAATRHTREAMVTVGVADVAYTAPVEHGQIVEILAQIVDSGRTSVTVEVTMIGEALLDGERRHCGRGRFTFVAVDAEGRPTPIPRAAPRLTPRPVRRRRSRGG